MNEEFEPSLTLSTPRKRSRRQSLESKQGSKKTLYEADRSYLDTELGCNRQPKEKAEKRSFEEKKEGPVENISEKDIIEESFTPATECSFVNSRPLWPLLISKFLKALNLDQTLRAFDTELIILPPEFYENADSLLLSMLEEIKDSRPPNEPPNFPHFGDTKSYDNELLATESGAEETPANIEFKDSIKEMGAKINKFIGQRRDKINLSNLSEFIDAGRYEEMGCSRASPATIDKVHHKKIQVIHNRHGPLLPTVKGGPSAQAKELSALSKTIGFSLNGSSADLTYATIIERLENTEKHLNIIADNDPARSDLTPIERIKAVELRLMQLEREYPTWAAIHFNQPNSEFPPPSVYTRREKGDIFLSPNPKSS